MRANRVWIGLVVAVASLSFLVPDASAQSMPPKGSVTVYGLVGGLNMNMDSVNNSLEKNETFLRDSYVMANYEIFGLTGNLGGGMAYQMMDRVAISVEYSRMSRDLRNNTYAGSRGQYTGFLDNTHAKLQDLSLNLTWYPPVDKGIFLGGGLGYGWSDMSESIDIVSELDPDSDTHYRGNWTGSGLSAQAYLGYHFDFVAGTKVTMRGGYHYLDMGDPSGTTVETSINGVSDSQQLPLGTVGWDFSGWNVVLSVGYSFFGGTTK